MYIITIIWKKNSVSDSLPCIFKTFIGINRYLAAKLNQKKKMKNKTVKSTPTHKKPVWHKNLYHFVFYHHLVNSQSHQGEEPSKFTDIMESTNDEIPKRTITQVGFFFDKVYQKNLYYVWNQMAKHQNTCCNKMLWQFACEISRYRIIITWPN